MALCMIKSLCRDKMISRIHSRHCNNEDALKTGSAIFWNMFNNLIINDHYFLLKTPESFHPQSQPHRDPTGNYRALAQSLTRDFGCSKKALEFTLLLEASFGTTNKSWPTAFQFP